MVEVAGATTWGQVSEADDPAVQGWIVSALLMTAQGGCLPSVESPNPVGATMDLPARAGNGSS